MICQQNMRAAARLHNHQINVQDWGNQANWISWMNGVRGGKFDWNLHTRKKKNELFWDLTLDFKLVIGQIGHHECEEKIQFIPRGKFQGKLFPSFCSFSLSFYNNYYLNSMLLILFQHLLLRSSGISGSDLPFPSLSSKQPHQVAVQGGLRW